MKPSTRLLLKCQRVVESCTCKEQHTTAYNYLGLAGELFSMDDEEDWVFRMQGGIYSRSYK